MGSPRTTRGERDATTGDNPSPRPPPRSGEGEQRKNLSPLWGGEAKPVFHPLSLQGRGLGGGVGSQSPNAVRHTLFLPLASKHWTDYDSPVVPSSCSHPEFFGPMTRCVSLCLAVFFALAPAVGAADASWAFKSPRRPTPPAVRDRTRLLNPIDVFVLARLEAHKLTL